MEENQQGLPTKYQETGVEIKKRPTSKLTNLEQRDEMQFFQRLVIKYRWIPADSPHAFRKLNTEFYLGSQTTVEDAVEFALANPPLPLTGADWSNKLILTNGDVPISLSHVPIDVVIPHLDEKRNERGLEILSDPDYYEKEAAERKLQRNG